MGRALTDSSSVRGTRDDIIVQVQILVKYFGIKLDLAVEPFTEKFPACSGMSDVHSCVSFSSSHDVRTL